jgi:hypothetical protein
MVPGFDNELMSHPAKSGFLNLSGPEVMFRYNAGTIIRCADSALHCKDQVLATFRLHVIEIN